MTRQRSEVARVQRLGERRLSRSAISRTTGIPRRTVGDWLNGKVPARTRRRTESITSGDAQLRAFAEPRSYAYLLGLYLGDGCISEYGSSALPRLRLVFDARYPAVVAGAVEAIAALLPDRPRSARKRSGERSIEVGCYSRAWPALFPQHAEGKKHLRPIILQPWQRLITFNEPEELIRGLIHSDGCRFTARQRCRKRVYEYPRYAFANKSGDIRRVFTDHLDLLEIEWRPMTVGGVQIARRSAVRALDEFVGPKA